MKTTLKNVRQKSKPLLRLFGNDEVHGSEEFSLSTPHASIAGDLQRLTDIESTGRHHAKFLEHPQAVVSNELAACACSLTHKEIPSGLSFEEISLERVVPWDIVFTLCEVFFVEDLESDCLQGFTGLGDGTHLGDTVTVFDLLCEFTVLGIFGVPSVGHAPFVDTEL